MSTTWYDLSDELRQMIIDYVITDNPPDYTCFDDGEYHRRWYRFVPREKWNKIQHADEDTDMDDSSDDEDDDGFPKFRGEVEEAAKEVRRDYRHSITTYKPCKKPQHLKLLMVSKEFLSLAIVQSAIFKHATIRVLNTENQDIPAMHASIGGIGFAQIRRLFFIVNRRSQLAKLNMSTDILNQLKNLREVKAAGSAIRRSPVGIRYQLSDLITPSSRAFDDLKDLLSAVIGPVDDHTRVEVAKFVAPETESRFERIVRFSADMYNPPHYEMSTNPVIEVIEYKSALKCCVFNDQPSTVMPQRLSEAQTSMWPPLSAINEVPLYEYLVEEEELEPDNLVLEEDAML